MIYFIPHFLYLICFCGLFVRFFNLSHSAFTPVFICKRTTIRTTIGFWKTLLLYIFLFHSFCHYLLL